MFKPEFQPDNTARANEMAARPPQSGEAPLVRSQSPGALVAAGFGDWVIVAVVFASANELAHWRLKLGEVLMLLGFWAGVLLAGAWLRARLPRPALIGWGEVLVGLAGWWAWHFLHVVHRLPGMQFAYSCVMIVGAVAGWRLWRRFSAAARSDVIGEPLRVLAVILMALVVTLPMITWLGLGGTDARWYAYMLHDFIEQWRQHGPPVFIGQGDYVWNGAVHPFRSAPVYMHVAGLWDWLTGGVLATNALQHLAAMTAAISSGLIVYGCGVGLVPKRRWAVAAVAMLYLLSPGVLMPLYMSDAYMTYMASAALALVFVGNACVLVQKAGWNKLAVGLSLAWMSHPPTAAQATFLTIFLQTGYLVFGPGKWPDWRRAGCGALLFIGLSLYYFVSMSELPKAPQPGAVREIMQIGGLLLGWVAVGQFLLMRRGWGWACLVVPAAGMLAVSCLPWLEWLGLTIVLVGGFVWAERRLGGDLSARYAPLIMVIAVVMAGCGMDVLIRKHGLSVPHYMQESQVWHKAWAADYFSPLTPKVDTDGDYQPGWGLWVLGALLGLAAMRPKATGAQSLFGALIIFSAFLIPWPFWSVFWTEFLPIDLRNMSGSAMPLRTMPVLAALLATGGLLALRGFSGWRNSRWVLGGMLLVMVGWGGWQVTRVLTRGFHITNSSELTRRDWMLENAAMPQYVYDLLPVPVYHSHGKTDPRLEARLIDGGGAVLYGPDDVARDMEAQGSRTISLTTGAIAGTDQWLALTPGFTVEPGEHLLLRFEFDPGQDYSGYLILRHSSAYREYHLPQSGLARAFGSGAGQSRVLSVWNTEPRAVTYVLEVIRQAGNSFKLDQHFATVVISRFQPAHAALQVDSLNPWRARVRTAQDAWLETPRIFLPGYAVTVNGIKLDQNQFGPSINRLLNVRLPRGEHTVQVTYEGSAKLKLAAGLSLLIWTGLMIGTVFLGFKGNDVQDDEPLLC